MKVFKALFDPFVLTALLVLASAAYTYYDTFLDRSFIIFTSEEEIDESIEREFPTLMEYL